MKKWMVYRDRASGQFRNERLFPDESCEQAEEELEERQPNGVLLARRAEFVRVLRDGQVVNKYEGELYDVVEADGPAGRRDMLKEIARLNGVAQVMES